MHIFQTISDHAGAMRAPLYAVTATVAARVDTPVLLILHWHGFRRGTPVAVPGTVIPMRPLPGSALQLNARWRSFDELDRAVLDAAWQLGAWEVERLGRRPWWRLGAPASEALAAHRAFGDYPDREPGQEDPVMEAPDRGEMLRLAARKGYVRWLFRPRKGGLWQELEGDDGTLDAGGGRTLPCPVPSQPYVGGRSSRTVYRLGRADRLIFPKHLDTKSAFRGGLKRPAAAHTS